jgi:hypothetical protein
MKQVKMQSLAKLLVVVLLIGGAGISAKIIYANYTKAMKVNPVLVESYRPHLNTALVKKAAESIKAKNEGLEDLISEEEKRLVETEEEIEAEQNEEAEGVRPTIPEE